MPNQKLKLSSVGLELIKKFEGLRLDAYLCSAGVPTIGYGTIVYPDGKKVKLGDKITLKQAEEYLAFKLQRFEADIKRLVKVPLTQPQYDALVSFVYNLGTTNFASSTLLKRINERKFQEAAEQLLRWNKAGGKVVNGLTRRREAEKALFESEPNVIKFASDIDNLL